MSKEWGITLVGERPLPFLRRVTRLENSAPKERKEIVRPITAASSARANYPAMRDTAEKEG